MVPSSCICIQKENSLCHNVFLASTDCYSGGLSDRPVIGCKDCRPSGFASKAN